MRNIFLLSPASLTGVRAKQLMSPRANFEAAQLYRSAEGVPIAIAFAFMSALYFRGKITYAATFAKPEDIHVIAPGFGFVPADWRITAERMKILQRTEVDVRNRNYCTSLKRSAQYLADKLDEDANVILLGSVAHGKYVDILLPIFGNRLKFPAAFAGLGDMSRGGLMLRAARAGRQLEYVSLDTPRHANGAVERARQLMKEFSSGL